MKQGIVLVSFGVSFPDVQAKTIDVFEAAVRRTYPDHVVVTAFTSEFIRRKIAKRGVDIPNTEGALVQLADAGVTAVTVQPTHLIAGDEYHKMRRQIAKVADRFDQVSIGRPLLFAPEDYRQLAEAIAAFYPCADDEALVLMGHGAEHEINAAYPALCYEFGHRGYSHVFLGTVEGYPAFEDVLDELRRTDYRRVKLAPLLFVAGDHAQNDMAGDEPDSWASQLQAAGYAVTSVVKGLGEWPEIVDLYLGHLAAAVAAIRPQA